jgi:hypothetical protein
MEDSLWWLVHMAGSLAARHIHQPLLCSLATCKVQPLEWCTTVCPALQKEIHLEVYQCSKQAVQLWTDGWFKELTDESVSGMAHLRNANDESIKLPVMISGKDTDEVDIDFFLVPVALKDHQGRWMSSFPVENRLTGQVCLLLQIPLLLN